MVGYGTSGDGIAGYNISPSFRVKREGANIFDVYDTDDEQDYAPNSPWEVWYYDFDGTVQGFDRDAWCEFAGVCGGSLGNDYRDARRRRRLRRTLVHEGRERQLHPGGQQHVWRQRLWLADGNRWSNTLRQR